MSSTNRTHITESQAVLQRRQNGVKREAQNATHLLSNCTWPSMLLAKQTGKLMKRANKSVNEYNGMMLLRHVTKRSVREFCNFRRRCWGLCRFTYPSQVLWDEASQSYYFHNQESGWLQEAHWEALGQAAKHKLTLTKEAGRLRKNCTKENKFQIDQIGSIALLRFLIVPKVAFWELQDPKIPGDRSLSVGNAAWPRGIF